MEIALPVDTRIRLDAAVELDALVRLAQSGSAEAATALFERCRKPLMAVIRHVIQPRLRHLYDSDDFLSETFLQIFSTYFNDQVLGSPEKLWHYLKRIAENKVRDANRKYLHTLRFNVGRVKSLESLTAGERAECLWAKDLSPQDSLLLKELVEDRLLHLVDQLPTMMQEIIKFLLEGATASEIAHRLEVEPKRVYRAMEWLKKQIRKEVDCL